MGELFRWERPGKPLAWTGERFVTEIDGDGRIEIEHLHRYFVARELCRGKLVLDIASGEGYGSALLAQTATHVTGVEVDASSVEHAANTYRTKNLRFLQGEAPGIPLGACSVDAVVCFETLEHFFDHESFLKEVKRVLKPDGFLLISTPDLNVYSSSSSAANPFHIRELTCEQFLVGLQAEFSKVSLLKQRVIAGSAIFPDVEDTTNGHRWVFERRNEGTFEADRQIQRAPYLIAIASNSESPRIAASVYIKTDQLHSPGPDVRAELEPVIARLSGEVGAARSEAEAARLETAAAKDAVGAGAQRWQIALEAASGRENQLMRELEKAQQEMEVMREQIKTSDLIAEQRQTIVRRLQHDLMWRLQKEEDRRKAAEKMSEEVARLESSLAASEHKFNELAKVYDEISRLIIPVWMRKGLPDSIRSPLRSIKRVFRHE